MKLFLNGALMDAEAAAVSPMDRGFTLADGLFETLAVRDGRILRLDAHLDRLARGAAVLGLPLPARDGLATALKAVRAENALAAGSLRLTVTRGCGPRGVLPPPEPRPTVLVTAAPAGPPLPPARLVTATVTRRNAASPLSRIKSLNYGDNILARQEAAARGTDDAVLLNTEGRIAETSIANLFAVIDGVLLTPPVRDGVLPGVMRAELLRAGAREAPLRPEDLARASEIVLTSALGLRSVAALDDRPLAATGAAERLRQIVEGA